LFKKIETKPFEPMIKHLLISVFLVFSVFVLHGQSTDIDKNQQILIDSLQQFVGQNLQKNASAVLDLANKMNATATKNKYKLLEARTNSVLASVYYFQNDLKRASKHFSKELEILEKLNLVSEIADSYFNLATIEQALQRNRSASDFYEKALKAARVKKDRELELMVLDRLALISEKLDRYKQAFSYYQQYINLKERRASDDALDEILTLRTKMKEEKKETEAIIKKKEKEIKTKTKEIQKKQEEIEVKHKEIEVVKTISDSLQKDVRQKEGKIIGLNMTNLQKDFAIMIKQKKVDEQKRRMMQIGIGAGILLLFIALLISLIRAKIKANTILRQKNQEIQEQKEEIEAQRDEIEAQRDFISHQNKDIKDSIYYAKQIQTALIPDFVFKSKVFSEYFVLFNPRDIVSGDFYWCTETSDYIVVAAADCTGHGVPGAFMSMLGMAYLDDIVNKESTFSPEKILDNLRNGIIKSLKQQGLSNQSKDGMDITVVTVDLKRKKVMYAGANNPIYVIQNEELTEYKGDRMPASYYLRMDSFTLHEFDIQKGMILYMFSDGFADQFGGPDGAKFKYKPFKLLLQEHHKLKADVQKSIIEQSFITWRGNQKQIDDVMVIGLRF
jgi:serine phosphatase RsbU (regulator of sigma subunit)